MSDKVKPVGILAGEGALPPQLIDYCQSAGIDACAVQFKGCHYQEWGFDIPIISTRLEKVGEIFAFFKKNDVANVVMIGNLKRPAIGSLRPDLKGLKTLKNIAGAYLKGDDNLLRSLKHEIEKEGFKIRGLDYYLDDLTAPVGCLTQTHYNLSAEHIRQAIDTAKKHGRDDKGQSILMHNDGSFSYEDRDGTASLIHTHGREDSILVKMLKPQQDPDLDRPTVGLETLKALYEKQCSGMMIQADAVFMIDKADMVQFADEHTLFIEAVNG